jgi:photosystem II stability/assembly factor-like uncharacterized protein
MIKKTLTLALLIFSYAVSQAQWKWSNPQPSGFACSKVLFTDHNSGFILNGNGDLLQTNDQGKNWRMTQNFPATLSMDIKYSTGVIAGRSGTLYLSGDNGASWQSVSTDIHDDFQLVDVVSRDTFFLAGSNGLIYMTGDRGSSWQTLNCKTGISSFDFVDSKLGFVGGANSAILKTTDGGVTWQTTSQVSYFPSEMTAIQFTSRDTGFAFRQYDSLLKTTDGGNTWTAYYVSGGGMMMTMLFLNSNYGYLAGQDGFLYRTTDGGITWAGEMNGLNGGVDANDILSLAFVSPDTGFAVGFRGRIMKTTDSAGLWQAYSPTYTPITTLSFGTASTGYATDGSHTYKTTDAGQHWDTLGLSTGTAFGDYSHFEHSHFINADTGFITSSNYVQIHTTTDGGKTWNTFNPFIYWWDNVQGMSFINKDTGYVSLASGTGDAVLFETRDAGNTWVQANTIQSYYQSVHQIFFVDELHGFGLLNGQVLRTADGGKTWAQVLNVTDNFDSFSSLWFVSAQKGFAAGEQGLLYMTTNGGNTWSRVPFNDSYTNDILAIRFYNEQVGYFTESSGEVYKTFDGGLTWQLTGTFGGETCNIIEYPADSSVYIAGDYGAILSAPLREVKLDSLGVNALKPCSEVLLASVGASLDEVDSIWWEYGRTGFTTDLAATPFSVSNGRVTCTATASDLMADSSYRLRLKLFYNGTYSYSPEYDFIAQGIPPPYIADSAGIIYSSQPSGNQWYLNGTTIPGATGTQLVATTSGTYTCRLVEDSCMSPFSNALQFITADLGVVIAPNPVHDQLYIENTQNRLLDMKLTDIYGRLITELHSGAPAVTFSTRSLSSGVYVLSFIDRNSGQKGHKSILKL